MKKTARLCLLALIFGIMTHPYIATAAAPDDERRPNEHRCPITLEVMREPVVASDGQSYENLYSQFEKSLIRSLDRRNYALSKRLNRFAVGTDQRSF
jgi:hypothetical protein